MDHNRLNELTLLHATTKSRVLLIDSILAGCEELTNNSQAKLIRLQNNLIDDMNNSKIEIQKLTSEML